MADKQKPPQGNDDGQEPKPQPNAVQRFWMKEPTVIVGVCSTLLSLAVAFGLKLTDAQTAAITATVTMLATILTRSQVTPVKKSQLPKDEED